MRSDKRVFVFNLLSWALVALAVVLAAMGIYSTTLAGGGRALAAALGTVSGLSIVNGAALFFMHALSRLILMRKRTPHESVRKCTITLWCALACVLFTHAVFALTMGMIAGTEETAIFFNGYRDGWARILYAAVLVYDALFLALFVATFAMTRALRREEKQLRRTARAEKREAKRAAAQAEAERRAEERREKERERAEREEQKRLALEREREERERERAEREEALRQEALRKAEAAALSEELAASASAEGAAEAVPMPAFAEQTDEKVPMSASEAASEGRQSAHTGYFSRRIGLWRILQLASVVLGILFYLLGTLAYMGRFGYVRFFIGPPHLYTSQKGAVASTVFFLLAAALTAAYLVFSFKLRGRKRALFADFLAHREEAETEEWIASDKKAYERMLKDYLKVNGCYYTDRARTKIKFRYKQVTNVYLALAILMGVAAAAGVFYVMAAASGVRGPLGAWAVIGEAVGVLILFFLYFFFWSERIVRFRLFALPLTMENLTAEGFVDEPYDERWLNYIRENEKLSKMAEKTTNAYSKSFFRTVLTNPVDLVLLAIPFIYVMVLVYVIRVVASIAGVTLSGVTGGSSDSYSETSSEQSSAQSSSETVSAPKKVIIEGRGYGEEYEVGDDGRLYRYGRWTDYHIIGNDIYDDSRGNKCVAFLLGYGYDTYGTVSAANGEEIPFMRWRTE